MVSDILSSNFPNFTLLNEAIDDNDAWNGIKYSQYNNEDYSNLNRKNTELYKLLCYGIHSNIYLCLYIYIP